MHSTRGPVNKPPLIYPQPSTTEARRRIDSPILFVLGVAVFLFALIFGISYATEGNTVLGTVVVLFGFLILGLLWRRFNKTST